MKKALPKLVLRVESIRTLSGMDLAGVVGGVETDATGGVGQSKDKQCPARAVGAPGR